ncbi:MFS general substrate transporter [Hypoxylon cercidicola]|nr:MFS general substrate transporter [Hypoxylon cercidicola]
MERKECHTDDRPSPQGLFAGEELSHDKSRKSLSFRLSVFGLALVALISAWDATSLAIALPVITSQLRGTTLESFWTNISFTLGVVITQPVYVSLSDILGRKPPLYASIVLFSVGAVVFATAHDMTTLIAGRLIQGLGGGGLYVLQDMILTDMTNLKERPLYIGFLAIAVAIGTILGPILGALFTDFASWRWIGWINLPILGVGCLIFVFFLHLNAIPIGFASRLSRVDGVGILLFAVGATAIALPLSWSGSLYPWSSWRTILPFVIGLVVLVIFVLFEKKVPVEPMLPFRILSNITAIASLVTGFFHGAIMYTLLLYLPLFFQAVFLQPPLQAAISTLPLCCVTVAFSFIAPVVVEITRRYRCLIWFGWVCITLFLGLWYRVNRSTPLAEAYTFQCLLGMGVGTVFTGTQVPVQASVTHVDDTGLAIGTLIVIRLFGALVSLSISSTVFSSIFQHSITAIGDLPESVKILKDPNQGIDFISALITWQLPDELLNRIVGAYTQAFQAIWVVMICFSGIGFLISLLIKDLTLEKEDIGRQGLEATS